MGSVKIVLDKHKKRKEGTVAVHVIKNRKPSYTLTCNYILENNWNATERCIKKSNPYLTKLNNLLIKKLSEAHASLLDA